MTELKRHQYFNLLHVLIIAPALWIALTPKLMVRFKINPEMLINAIKYVVIGMVLFHTYRFVTGFYSFKARIESIPVIPATQS